jgi:hypothetical protein
MEPVFTLDAAFDMPTQLGKHPRCFVKAAVSITYRDGPDQTVKLGADSCGKSFPRMPTRLHCFRDRSLWPFGKEFSQDQLALFGAQNAPCEGLGGKLSARDEAQERPEGPRCWGPQEIQAG